MAIRTGNETTIAQILVLRKGSESLFVLRLVFPSPSSSHVLGSTHFLTGTHAFGRHCVLVTAFTSATTDASICKHTKVEFNFRFLLTTCASFSSLYTTFGCINLTHGDRFLHLGLLPLRGRAATRKRARAAEMHLSRKSAMCQ